MNDDLIARLERAESGSRELDAEIWRAADPKKYERVALSQSGLYPRGFNPEMKAQWLVQRMASKAPSYTTSLDAALSLVPEGNWQWQLRQDPGCYRAGIVGGEIPNMTIFRGEGPSPALALCIAALRARG